MASEPDEMQKTLMALTIEQHIARYWREAEKSTEGRPDLFFLEDGEFSIEGFVEAKGRAAIRKVGEYRQQKLGDGPRHSRHIMTNYACSFADFEKDHIVEAIATMLHYGGTGGTPLPLEPPYAIYDVTMRLVRQSDGSWLTAHFHMKPIFIASNHPARGMPRDYSHPLATPA